MYEALVRPGRFSFEYFPFAFIAINQKRTFGTILTVLGIVGIIIGALAFLGVGGIGLSKMNSIVPFVVGLIFFAAGINLVKTTGDRA
ncbi:hypothetical protein [Hymenobacter rubidus]|uniref:hypothetical protein n=1 Tax=Hymenobacter rubidus TaxID=1441626 RepID=UPI001F1DBDE6|nr:hypothetical protein [Hymenobacter rubidus]